MQNTKTINVRKLTLLAMLSALATVLMFLSFNVPLMPSFIKMDFSELPALIASCTLGPLSGVIVCLIKNLINLMFTTTAGVGELSNFILGVLFVVPAGFICKAVKGFKGICIGAICGALTMAFCSMLTNYYVVYPVYTAFMPLEAILGMYQAINKNVENLWQALLIFNVPFTFIKGLCSAIILFAVYKPIRIFLRPSKTV